jgi:hypothetical protein
MDTPAKDWTHKDVKITDIRKLSEFYIFTIDGISGALLVKSNIFEERLKTYFLKDANRVSREEILNARWNMFITKGYYIKIQSNGMAQKFDMDPSKYYVSYLEISGPLGTFQSVCKEKDHKIN